MESRPAIRSQRTEMFVLIRKVLPVTPKDEQGGHVTANIKRSHLCEIDWKRKCIGFVLCVRIFSSTPAAAFSSQLLLSSLYFPVLFKLQCKQTWASQVVQWQRIHLSMQQTQETWARSLGWEDPLEEEMATHSSILAWRIRWTEEPGGLQSMGPQESDTTEHLQAHKHV